MQREDLSLGSKQPFCKDIFKALFFYNKKGTKNKVPGEYVLWFYVKIWLFKAFFIHVYKYLFCSISSQVEKND